MPEKQATIVQVAEMAQVSVATVSRVLSGGSASASARKKVEEAVRALDYRPPSPARKADGGSDRSLALVISDLTNPYYASLCAGAEEAARRAGWNLIVYQTALTGWMEDRISDRVAGLPAMGAVLVGSVVESGDGEAIRSRLCQIGQKMPIVTIGPRVEGVSCVNITSDLSLSVRKSISHLYALGHRRISFIGGSGGIRSSSARRRAYYEEMERLQLPADREISTDAGFTPRPGSFASTGFYPAWTKRTGPRPSSPSTIWWPWARSGNCSAWASGCRRAWP